eukprot:TRINITY_DN864_c0_g1_i2.p1 TRINITY_DN864_c0_g1~~TRINITY_DN864_c0_g1_i2.p1  ORF type:complete len:310 (-),score=156.89 TRINITY_DN864_c0_g1_i2:107-997(-)
MLKGKTILITGASRGIGKAIGLRAARDGANIVIVAKTSTPHPQLPGTIFSVAAEIEKIGGNALAIQCDIRKEEEIEVVVQKTVEKFGGIDILINNASAIWLKGTQETPMKRFDLMHQINCRGTYAVSRACLPLLKISATNNRNPHILNISPPLNMKARWFKDHVAYTMAKYSMSMYVLGMSAEFACDGIGVNALWPRTGIATAAIEWIVGSETLSSCRKPEIMADAAHIILSRNSKSCTGNFFIDDQVLASEGITNLDEYSVVPGTKDFMVDFFLDEDENENENNQQSTPKPISKL